MTRRVWFTATCLVVLGIATTSLLHPKPRLIWNASASVPTGLYAVRPAGTLRANELLVVNPPQILARFLADRRYLPEGVPLLKHVAALPGQIVCRTRQTITVDGTPAGVALERDHLGRPLPVWQGCITVGGDQIFLMNRTSASLDSRYFGPLPATTIVGRAAPLWIETAQ